MRTGISFDVTAEDRARLEAIVWTAPPQNILRPHSLSHTLTVESTHLRQPACAAASALALHTPLSPLHTSTFYPPPPHHYSPPTFPPSPPSLTPPLPPSPSFSPPPSSPPSPPPLPTTPPPPLPPLAEYAAPPSSGVHPLSQHHRGPGSGGKVIHAILDNYAAHKHPKVMAWLDRHPRWQFHFTPTSCSWLNAVEGFSPG